MIYVESLLAQPAGRALGWALLHFLWQGTLVALALGACNFLLRDSSARLRYAVSCFCLLVLLALPVITCVASLAQTPAEAPPPAAFQSFSASQPITAVAIAIVRPRFQDAITPFLPWIVSLWLAGVVVLSVRWIAAWAYLHRLRRTVSSAIPPEWGRILRDLAQRAAISTPVRLSIHRLAQSPCVIGWLRPVIILPAAALAGLDWRAFEALLAHELGHIRRHDYLVNLLQTVVDTLLFYHPAVWWVSRQIRIERENCCDDFAAQLCGDRVTYARALLDLEQIREPQPAFAMSARGGSLMHRIQRLLRSNSAEAQGPAWLPGVAGLAILTFLAVAIHSPARAQRPAQPTPGPAPAETQVHVGQEAPSAHPTRRSHATAAPAEQSQDFLAGIVAAGFRNLTIDELIDLKIHGVTPEFAAAVKQAGYSQVTAGDLVNMAIHGVDLDYMQGLRKAGLPNLSIEELVDLRIHGVTPDYIAELRTAGYPDLTADKYKQLRIHGVDAAFIRHLGENGFHNPSLEQLLRLKLAGF